jgi:hypothetical protein
MIYPRFGEGFSWTIFFFFLVTVFPDLVLSGPRLQKSIEEDCGLPEIRRHTV